MSLTGGAGADEWEGGERGAADQRRHPDAVVALTGQQDEAHEIAEGVDERHDLAGQPAA